MLHLVTPAALDDRLDALVDEHPAADPTEAAVMLRSLLDAAGPQDAPLDRATARDLCRAADHLHRS